MHVRCAAISLLKTRQPAGPTDPPQRSPNQLFVAQQMGNLKSSYPRVQINPRLWRCRFQWLPGLHATRPARGGPSSGGPSCLRVLKCLVFLLRALLSGLDLAARTTAPETSTCSLSAWYCSPVSAMSRLSLRKQWALLAKTHKPQRQH